MVRCARVAPMLESCPLCDFSEDFSTPRAPDATVDTEYRVSCPGGCGDYAITLDAMVEVRAWRTLNPARLDRLVGYVQSRPGSVQIDKAFIRRQR